MDLRQLLGGATGSAIGGRPHRTPPFFRTKKVAILGCTTNIVFAPWHDPSWTLVSHCSARQFCQREPDWYFDLHRPECFESKKSWNRQYQHWLRTLQTPIFMQEDQIGPWAKIPMAVRYPIERITAEFASSATGRLYATNHAAYMIALAMTEGVTHIGLYGCQYANDTEYGVQRDSLTYWLGRFEQYGGTIVIPATHNTLLSMPKALYGYGSHTSDGKLTEEYRGRATKKAPPATTPGPPVIGAEVTSDGRCDVPLMTLPDGEVPSTSRLAALYGR